MSTENPTPAEPAADPAPTSTEAPEVTTETPDTEDNRAPSSEAKNYRLRLRDTEAERDALQTTHAELQTAHDDFMKTAISAVMTEAGVNADTLWKLGRTPADFITDKGFDIAEIKMLALEVATEAGLRSIKDKPHPIPGAGERDDEAKDGKSTPWAKAIRGRNVR